MRRGAARIVGNILIFWSTRSVKHFLELLFSIDTRCWHRRGGAPLPPPRTLPAMMATGVTMVQTPGAQITVVSPTVVRRAPVGLCTVGALLSVVSLSTTGWMEGNIAPGVKVSSGLWSSCVTMSSAGFGGSTTQCTSYNIKDLAAVIHATRFFALVGFFASVVSVALAVAISKVRVWVLVEARRGHGHTDARRERAQSTKDCASVNFWWPFLGLSLLHVRWGRGACGCFHPPRKDSGRAHGFSLGGVWCLTLAWGVRARKGEGAVINQTVKTVCWRGRQRGRRGCHHASCGQCATCGLVPVSSCPSKENKTLDGRADKPTEE